MDKLVQTNVPDLGNITLRSYLTFGQLADAYDLVEKAGEAEKADVFTNFILSRMFVEPQKTPEDISRFGPEALNAVVQAVVDIHEIRKEFDATAGDLPIRARFYEAHVTKEHELSQALVSSISQTIERNKLIKFNIPDLQIGEEFVQLGEAALQMSALNAMISLPKMPDTITPILKQFEQAADVAKTMSLAKMSLEKLVEGVSQIKLPETLFRTALIASGLDSPIIHSSTYVPPAPLPIEEEIRVPKEDAERQRLVGAYDVLIQLEQALREIIEKSLRELHGDSWWKRGTPPDVRGDCETRKAEKEKPFGASHHPIYYAYFHDYRKIILKGDNWQNIFADIFGNKTELEACFNWVSNVRDPAAHIRPISDEDYSMFIAGAKWIQVRINRKIP